MSEPAEVNPAQKAREALIKPHLEQHTRYAVAAAAEFLASYMETSDAAETMHTSLVTIFCGGSKLGDMCAQLEHSEEYACEEAAEFGTLIANELAHAAMARLAYILRHGDVFGDRHKLQSVDLNLIHQEVGA